MVVKFTILLIKIMKNMLSVMPYTSVGKVGFIRMSKLLKHMKGEPQPEVDKPKN